MKKRLLSAITAVTLLLGTFPAGMISVSAADDTVEYNRLWSEVAILNQYTGNSSSFYTSLKGALKQETGTTYASYPDYNAVQALYGGDSGMWSWKAIFGDSDDEVKLSWNPLNFLSDPAPSFADSTLKQVMKTKNNLYVKMSAEFQNYTHKHTFWKVVVPKQVEVHNFLSGKLSIGGNTTLSISGLDGVGLSNYRDGDDDAYYPLNYNSDDGGGITFTKADIEYTDGKNCTCSGATADHLLVTFRDDRAPKVSNVEYSSDGTNFGGRFNSGMKKQLGGGDTLYIKLTFDEPIRFSDDSAVGKENLNLGLKMQGLDVWKNMRATLYKLDNNALYFKYTVPSDLGFDEENMGLDADIISLDASSLYDSNKELKLKQMSRISGSFEISDDKLAELNIKDSYGFNTTDCYITDLAGNAWEETEITNAYLHIDTQTPIVESINWGLNLNNADVKEALGSSNAGDNSDLYLGVGDSINMTVAMSEPLDIEPYKQEGTGYPLYDWKHAVATTNIKDKNGKYVTITSRYYTPLEQNKHRLQNTVFVMQGLTIEDGMYVEKTEDNPNGEVRVTKFDLSGYGKDIADMRGNKLVTTNVTIKTGAGSNPPKVATAPPTVTEVANGYFDTDDGFRQAVAIEDNGGTGVAGIYGSFTLSHSGDSGTYRYLWATSASADASNLTWNTGVTGEAQRFIQHETTYFHIKSDPTEDYVNLNSCVLTVNAKDYAGNIGSCTVDSNTIIWYVDNLPPTVTAGDMTRTLNGDQTGTLFANFTLRDSHGISAWQYGWSDDEVTDPTAWENGDTTGIGSQTTATVTVTQTVNMGENFGKYLWVKATDNSKSKNQSDAVCMGKYTYNLSQAEYVLKHTTAITKTPEIAVTSMGLEDSLVVAVREDSDDEHYYFRILDGSSYTANQNIFGGSGWQECRLTATDTGCSIQITDSSPSVGWMTNENYAGNLEVRVFAGRTDGLADDGSPIVVGANGYSFSEETFTLRVNGSGTYAKRNHSIVPSEGDMGYVTAKLTEDLQIRNEKEIWSGDTNLLDTLAGKQVEIVVTKDRYGWNCEDIDLQRSKLILTNQHDASDIHEFALNQFRKNRDDGTWLQRITLGGEFATGMYTAQLQLALVNAAEGEEVTIMVKDKDGHPTDIAPLTVDATVPNENLQLSAITYGHKSDTAYQLNQVYPEEWNCIGEDDVAILPMAGGYFEPTGDPSMFTYAVTFTSEGEKDLGALYDKYNEIWTYTGQYRVEVWDKANPDKVVKFYPYQSEELKTGYTDVKIGYTEACSNNGTDASDEKCCGITVNANGKDKNGMLYLEPDTEEGITLCYRKVYANGRTTTTREQVVRPVTSYLTGTMSIDEKNWELVFTPTSNEATNRGATVYALAYQNTDDWENGGGEQIPMGYAADGTWRCNLKENGAIYRILTINRYGSVWASEKTDCLAQRAPWTRNNDNKVYYEDNGDGTYTASAWLYDDLNTIRKDGLDLEIGFNEAYDAEGYGIHVTDDLFGDGFRYTEKTKGLSRNGIYEVYLEASSGDEDCLYVKIQGVVQKSETMNLTLRATDAFGNRWEGSTGDQTVTYREPEVSETALGDKGLKLTFNQPVLPTESWAWVESLAEETDYQTVWEGAFPVTSNGEHTISFKDIFGNVCEQTFTTEAFTKADGDDAGDWSMNLTLSETELTKDAVKLTASLPYANATTLDSGTSIRDGNSDIMVPEGRYNGYPFPANPTVYDRDGDWTSGNSGATSTPRTVSTDQNGRFTVGVYHNTFVNDNHNGLIYSQKVYINNIANEAPDAELLYYNSLWGTDFTKAELEAYLAKQGGSLTLEDTVRVRYRTTRHVTATDGGSEFFFTVENQGESHTFSYQDDMGNTASVTATLPTGLTLKEPDEPYVDTTPPTVSVGIWYEYKGVYTEADGFLAGETTANITSKVQNLGAVSAVGFKILASDESGFDISFTATDDKGNTVGADDVTLEGNMLTVCKAADITITVTDRATTPNSTTITLTQAMFDKLDNTPPAAKISTEADGMYGRKVIIELSDTNNKGEDTSVDSEGNDAITLTAPSGAVRTGTNKYEYTVTENGTVNFVFYDRAGNRNKSDGSSAEVSGIDTNPPVLTTTWAPPLTYWDDMEEKTVIDHSEPTSEVVSTNVTAFIDSDKTLKSLSLEYGGDPIELLDSSAANYQNPYRILGQDNKVLATVTATPERVSVEYEEYYGQDLNFTATAANGKSATKTVTGYVSIDKEAPIVTVSEPANLYRTKADETPYTVPYAVKFTLTPNEAVYSPNYGETETVDYGNGKDPEVVWKYYTDDEPLTITFTENGTYAVFFSDIAGNSTVEKVTVSGIDRTAPVITLGERTESGQSVTVAVTVDEASTVTADNTTYTFAAGETKEITFTDNATYAVVAVDDAGNESRRTIVVGSIDRVLPSISFYTNTVYAIAGGDRTAATDELKNGYAVSDNKTQAEDLIITRDDSKVEWDTAGLYPVKYTVTDEAGNTTEATRFVQIIGKNTVCVSVDGKVILPNSTAVLRPGSHKLELQNSDEPYSVKARLGIRSLGQMKNLTANSLTFDEDGNFTVGTSGYYTLQITTQSRQVIRILLYVEP